MMLMALILWWADADYPDASYVALLPAYRECKRCEAESDSYREYLAARGRVEPIWVKRLEIERQSPWQYTVSQVYETAAKIHMELRKEYPNLGTVRQYLRYIRERIGPEAFYAGQLPPPVPLDLVR